MRISIFLAFLMYCLSGPTSAISSEGKSLDKDQALNQKQQCLIPIAALTAEGDIDRLKPALIQGLDGGLTINEVKEVLVHLYAYSGFPRSLNALSAFMEVLEVRKAKGIEDVMGRESTPVPTNLDKDAYGAKVRAELAGMDSVPPPSKWQVFSPVIDTFLKEHLFADIFARDVLDRQERELVTIAALAAMPGTEGQLRFHITAAMNTGLSEAQMKDVISVLLTRVGKTQAESAQKMLTETLSKKKRG